MNNMNKLVIGTMGIFLIVIMFTIIPYVGDTVDNSRDLTEKVDTISVFVLDEGTTATHVTCGIYETNTNRLIATTDEQLITPDAWNVCDLPKDPKIDMKEDYILVAFADGEIAIPSDGTNYIQDTGNTYDYFPTTIDYSGTEDSELSIYAIYV